MQPTLGFFAFCRRLAVIFVLAGLVTVVTALAAGAGLPRGAQIAYLSSCDGSWDIYLLDAGRGASANLTRSAEQENAFLWSADGGHIGFIHYEGSQPSLHVYDLYGASRPASPDREGWVSRLLEAVPVRGDWSDDQSRRVYELANEIYILDENRGVQRITDNTYADESPNWSPDEGLIAFASNRDGSLDIYIMDADGLNVRRLTSDGSRESSPVWSLDGQQIVFTSQQDRTSEIYTVNLDGSAPRRLTVNACWDDRPAWRP
ncbi:MAG: PD40 domain-containing protein [Chloroflexi bacterium]|nr:PD40 domain-containing protein [Chloroflexota bacterium]